MNQLLLTLFSSFLLATAMSVLAAEPSRILMVVTSHDRIDDTHPTGLWLEEFAIPYEIFTAAGHEVAVASTKGGTTPIDPRSLADREKFAPETLAALQSTDALASMNLSGYDAVFFPGGHGTMYDLPADINVAKAVTHFLEGQQPIALVCHGPAALVGATLADGTPAASGRKVTGFTNDEEKAVELDDVMPFLLETKLREQGATFIGASNFVAHVVVDGNLITGQNPASSADAAQALLKQLANKAGPGNP